MPPTPSQRSKILIQPPTPALPKPKYKKDLILLILKRGTPLAMPPTPARLRPKYIRDIVILILNKGAPAHAADPDPA